MKKIALFFTILLFIGFVSNAQTRLVTGTVTSSEDDAPIPGVSISVKGTTLGTITDINGEYTLEVPENAEALVFSFIGMKTMEVPIDDRESFNVAMESDVLGIDEVVVVGYGTATKQSFVGSFKEVDAEKIQSKTVSNVSQALAGESAGVRVINTSGQPGSEATIRIRGFGSVNGNRDPLYVVDGVPYSGSINAINPNDIESVTILKDATATAIYGSRGANGVILVNTASGKTGENIIEANVKTGVNVSALPRYSTISSPEEYIGLSWEAMYNRGVASGAEEPIEFANENLFGGVGINEDYNLWNADGGELIDPATRMVRPGVSRLYDPEDWEDYGFQNSSRTETNLAFRGGTEATKYYTSFGYLKDVGYIINSDFERYNASLDLENTIKPWLTTSTRMAYARTITNNNGQSEDSGSIFWFVDNIPPIFPLFLRDESGGFVEDPVFGGNQYDYGVGRAFGALTNSIADAHYDRSRSLQNQISGHFNMNIKFTENLTLENTFGAQYYVDKFVILNNPFYGSAAGQGGYVYRRNNHMSSFNLLNLLRYKTNFGEHYIEALAAHESNLYENKFENAQMEKMVHPDIAELSNFIKVAAPPFSYIDRARLESYFGQLNYNYQSKYYLSASVRRDGSSRFIGDNKWDTFGSAGFSWVVSEEDFMQSASLVDFLKYKISYGLIGEQQGVGYYPAYNTYNVNNLNDEISISENEIGNPDLTWETSKMFQTGVEFGLGKYLEGSVDYYLKNTENLLFDRRVGPSVGYALITVNDGVLRNSGIEFEFTAHLLTDVDYELNFSINGEILNNELIEMPIEPATGEPKLLDIQGNYGRAKGYSLFDFYLREWAGVDPGDGKAMWFANYYDENSNGQMDSGEGIASLFEYTTENPDNEISETVTKTYANATQRYIGKSAIPDLRGGFRLDGRLKNFDFSAQFLYSLGGYAYDFAYASLMDNPTIGSNNWSVDILDRWQEPGDITNVPRLSSNYDTNLTSPSTRFLTPSDYLALNNVQIGYTFPEFVNDIGISYLNIFVSGDNLFLLSARDGFNPSTSETGASDRYRYSPLSTYSAGLRINF